MPHRTALLYPEASDRGAALRRGAGSERRIATERRSERRIAQPPCSRTATAQWRTLHDFSSVRAINIVSTTPARSLRGPPDPGSAHPPNNVCLCWQSLLGVVAKIMQDTAFRRLGNCPKRRIGVPHHADTSDRDAASRCIALPEASDRNAASRRPAGPGRRIAPHIHVRIATIAGENCGLVRASAYWLATEQSGASR